MDAFQDKERFDAMLAAAGVPLDELKPRLGLDPLLRLHAENPAGVTLYGAWSNVSIHGPEEMGFTFLWACNASHDSELFAHSEFSLLCKVGPPAVAGNLRGFMAWCTAPEQAESFRSTVETSDCFHVWGDARPTGVRLLQDIIGLSRDDLFDCWGVRNPSCPVVSMNEDQWSQSDDVPLMLRWFRQEWQGERADLDRLLQRYLLACCRRIWKLLPLDASRRGVEVAERDLKGEATREEVARARYEAEGAAFHLDPSNDRAPPVDEDSDFKEAWTRYEWERRADVERLAEKVKAIPPEELRRLVRTDVDDVPNSPHALLESAAYFAETSMLYPGLPRKESVEQYQHFLPAPLLREIVGNPFRARPPATA